jgi:opacity protein-like surface antigen
LKLLLSCGVTSFLLISHSVLADSAKHVSAGSLDFGIAYKRYSMDLPSRVATSEDDDANEFAALALIATDDVNKYMSIRFEAAKGIADSRSGYNFTIDALNPIDINETYTTQLDYSLSVTAKFRLLANKSLSPFLLLGGNASAISYDYEQTIDGTITAEDSETLTSSGLLYGAGFEWVMDENVELSLSYENLSHFKYDVYAWQIQHRSA